MSLVLEFFPEAAAELECATGEYEARVPGLGVRFRQVVESTCSTRFFGGSVRAGTDG
jgi:hypothetical protein